MSVVLVRMPERVRSCATRRNLATGLNANIHL